MTGPGSPSGLTPSIASERPAVLTPRQLRARTEGGHDRGQRSRSGTVTVVGAGFYGSTTAQRLAEYDIFEKVVLTDIVEGKPEGLALDLNQSRPIEGFETEVVGATTDPRRRGVRARSPAPTSS